MSHLKPFLFVFLIVMGVVFLGSEPVGAGLGWSLACFGGAWVMRKIWYEDLK